MADGAQASDGALSITAAVGLIGGSDKEPVETNTAASPAETADGDGATESTDATTSETGSEAEQPGDAENAQIEGDENLTLEPPRWWSKERKDRFRELPPDLQAVVFEQEETRERVVAKAKQESAEAKKTAETQAAKLAQQANILDQLIPHAFKTFQDRWANVDWTKVAQQVDPAEYNRLRAQHEQEQQTVRALAENQRVLQGRQFEEFVKAEAAKLPTIAPDLVDAKLGLARRESLGKFLVERGFAADRINAMSAEEASIAYDAMRWRQAQAKATTLSKTKPAPAPSAAVRPTAARTGSTQSRSTADAASRLSKTGRIDDAVAVLNARNR